MSILGTRVRRSEDPRFLTSGGVYVADVADPLLDGALYVTYVRSMVAHGRLLDVDVSEARSAPGVVAVFTGEDIAELPLMPLAAPMLDPARSRPVLATDRVRFVGEPVAAIVSETPQSGADAAEGVWADVDFLPAVITRESALSGETLLFDGADDNIAFQLASGGDDDIFADCEVVVSADIVNQRVAGASLEGRSAAAAWDGDRLVHFVSTQSAHGTKSSLCDWYGLEADRVRVVAPDVGGGFGPKIGAYPEEALLGWIAQQVGRPVRWTETRSENMVAMAHGRGQWQTVTIGGRRDGTVEAYRLDVVQDSGAYPSMGAILPFLTQRMLTGVYEIERSQFTSRSVTTNTTPVAAYRGAGRPEATAAIERAMDLFALEIGADPVEVRNRNLIAADAFPYTTGTGTTYDIGDYAGALERVVAAADYQTLREEQARRRSRGDTVQLGIGVSVYVEVTAGPSPGETEYGRVEIHADGTATAYTGSSAHGQGHDTAFAMLVSDQTGIPLESITVRHGDTDDVPRGVGTFGSRSLQLGGSAIHEATAAVVERARELAADELEAAVDDVVIDTANGAFHVVGTPSISRSWSDIAAAAGPDGLGAEIDFESTAPTFPFGAHLAVVTVDTETGLVRLERLVACDDAGTILNPLLAEGQRHGGIAQGVAQAIYEAVRYDDDGNPVTANFADYTVVSAAELPSFELVAMETPTPLNALGAKGIGESGTIGSTPAVQSAVVDAVSHLGVRHVDMPCTPEVVWSAIQAAEKG